MTNQSFRFSLFFWICLSAPLTATAQTVNIPDPNLRAAIERSLNKASADVITAADMATLIDFDAPNINITDLTGLEHATNLIHLDLGAELVQVLGIVNSNSISDISPLAGLTQLTSLDLENNSISDISPLGGLTNLTQLYLSDNAITDISPLGGLYQLTTLWIQSNSITDLSPLGRLTNLTWLDLRSNAITDISPLAGLYQLISLWLSRNAITDISPLAGLNTLIHLLLDQNSITDISPLAGLYQLTALRLHKNSITDISPLAGLNTLAYLLLHKNSIIDISPLAGLNELTTLFLDNNSISDISPLAGLNQLTELDLRHNSISDISPLVENTGLGSEDYVKLTENPLNSVSINTHIPTLQSRGVAVEFSTIFVQPEPPTQTVNIPDPNLRAELENALDKAPGAIITVADMAALTMFFAGEANISDLTGLEHATNLTILWLTTNNISDISPLAGLTQLTNLWLDSNSISDISPLAGLTNLTNLQIWNNSISDLSPLVANTGLGDGAQVNVWGNFLNALSINTHIPALQSRGVTVGFDNIVVQPGDITQIVDIPDPDLRAAINDIRGKAPEATITAADMSVLTYLYLFGEERNISDLTGLEHATNLTRLLLPGNSISDISPLAGLTNLTELELRYNSISDISPIAGLTQLTHLYLGLNNISDISALTGLTNLEQLLLWNNNISDISAVAGLNQLIFLQLDHNSISDISAVTGLTHLTELSLYNNAISDLSPLVENTGLGSEDWVDVRGNPLSTLSINTHIPTLQSRGVAVGFDDIVAQPADVNGDGVVNIFDLVSVASHFGKQGQNLTADVNRDGVVDILDLVFVAGMFGDAAAAPSANPQAPEILTAAAVRGWLTDAKALEIRDPIMKRGVMVLEQLLVSLTPKETELLANYPNPFNPETWIPYRLAEDALVTLTIYDGAGQVVRTLDVGHQVAAVYENRSEAIYWDGRNGLGETVASGVYFYHLAVGNYSATRKMLILK